MKAMPLRTLNDVEVIKHELNLGNILILKITPLARKSVEDVKKVVNELSVFTQSIGGDIASLGEERVVIVPNFIRIWRQETAVSKKTPTAA
ncbi:MAG: cell division protein SepF [Candidatus Bathyarchaeota archaeon]